jgi:hypothetical protein
MLEQARINCGVINEIRRAGPRWQSDAVEGSYVIGIA